MNLSTALLDPQILAYLSARPELLATLMAPPPPIPSTIVPSLWNPTSLLVQQSLMQQINDPRFRIESRELIPPPPPLRPPPIFYNSTSFSSPSASVNVNDLTSAGKVEAVATSSAAAAEPLKSDEHHQCCRHFEEFLPASSEATNEQRPPSAKKNSDEKSIVDESIDNKSENETAETFEMGSLPTSTYYPTHFMKGTQLELPNGALKKVEEMSTDDFLKCAAESKDVDVNASSVRKIQKTIGAGTINFETMNQEVVLKVQREHPFFVLGKGWSSCDPQKTAENYGLECANLEVGDICIVLTQRAEESNLEDDDVTDIIGAETEFENSNQRAFWRETLSEIYEDYFDENRLSAPPERIISHPPPMKKRKTSESCL